METTKICRECKITKSIIEFHIDKTFTDGRTWKCKACIGIQRELYKRTKEGHITCLYGSQRGNSKRRGHKPPSYTRSELVSWCLSQENFHIIYDKWVESNYNNLLAPSIDRKNDYKSYCFENIQLMTWEDNHIKGHCDIKNGVNNKNSKAVLQYSRSNVFISEYFSSAEAQRQTEINKSHIGSCCRYKRKTAGGFIWKYKHVIIKEINSQG